MFVICIRNDDYPAYIRVIDESGEDYLYPEAYFKTIVLPDEIKRAVIEAA